MIQETQQNLRTQESMKHDQRSKYLRFAAMIATSVIVMYGLMYLNTFEWSHVRWSETRVYMALIMGAAMAIIMLSFMLGMYKDTRINVAIYAASILIFLAALFLVRSQTLVGDSSYMRAMIPHHSIAILTSERAQIEDVRVRELADEIIEAQRREIQEMDWLLNDIAANGIAATQDEADARPVPEFEAQP
jgi:FlaA1/EpsC-like NDP-sugar epimerase